MSFAAKSPPLVSVILPVYNEAAHIEQVVLSILRQSRSNFDLELLVIDGNSTDGTSDLLKSISASNPEVRLLQNPRRMTPLAFNIGLKHAKGEYACIFGAHTAYDQDYIAVCLSEAQARGAAGCGGRVLTTPADGSLQARLVAAALGTSFGTSSKSFRNHPEGYADNVNYPVLGAYFGVAMLVSCFTALRKKWLAGLLLPPVFLSLHASYGMGTLWALLCNANSPEAALKSEPLGQTEQVHGAQ
jgi:glycosyltransferase involved in cell wall biosynthesis